MLEAGSENSRPVPLRGDRSPSAMRGPRCGGAGGCSSTGTAGGRWMLGCGTGCPVGVPGVNRSAPSFDLLARESEKLVNESRVDTNS